MSFESVKNSAKQLNPVDFAQGLYDGAVQYPLDALQQLTGNTTAPAEHQSNSPASKAGNIAGFIVDFTALSKLTGRAINPLLGKAADGVLGSGVKMATSGSLYGGLLTPSSSDKSLLQGRLENAAVSGTTFGIMGGAGKALEQNKVFGMFNKSEAQSLPLRTTSNAIAGGAGGVAEVYGATYFSEHRAPTAGEMLGRAAQYAAFGAGFSTLDYGLHRSIAKIEQSEPVQQAYYSARNQIRDTKTELKRDTYSLLNKYDMQHPLQRVGDFIHNSKAYPDITRPQLTPENNPIISFEKELPQYFKAMDQAIKNPDLTSRRHPGYVMRDINTAFSEKLLGYYHGTKDQPGIAFHSDSELATADTSAARVAQIRNALTSTAERTIGRNSPDPLTKSLADLAQFDLGQNFDDFMIFPNMAKSKFFDYEKVSQKMAQPEYLGAKDHHMDTPLSWMPFQATEQLPNLFHGSVSSSLPSIFKERSIYPSKEMRLRGIEQQTGETAGQVFPKAHISMTRDFNEALTYQLHSPDSITHFPIVFGISKDVIPRAQYAGSLEKGEILIDKLKLGQSWQTRLGLKQPEVTHLYVPDSKIPTVNRMLDQQRMRGVKVVGFKAIKAPDWSTEPELPLDRY